MIPFGQVIKAMTPTLLLIGILIVTRIHQLGLKGLLNSTNVIWEGTLGFLGHITLSDALIVRLSNVFGTLAAADYKTLYVLALIPFFLVVFIGIFLFRLKRTQVKTMFVQTAQQTNKPFIALFGALIMVNLMMQGGENAPVYIIGRSLAGATGELDLFRLLSRRTRLVLLRLQYRVQPDLRRDPAIHCPDHRPECQFNPRAPVCRRCHG